MAAVPVSETAAIFFFNEQPKNYAKNPKNSLYSFLHFADKIKHKNCNKIHTT